ARGRATSLSVAQGAGRAVPRVASPPPRVLLARDAATAARDPRRISDLQPARGRGAPPPDADVRFGHQRSPSGFAPRQHRAVLRTGRGEGQRARVADRGAPAERRDGGLSSAGGVHMNFVRMDGPSADRAFTALLMILILAWLSCRSLSTHPSA